MLKQETRVYLLELLSHPEIVTIDIADYKHSETSVNIHTTQDADEDEILNLLIEVFPDLYFADHTVLFEDCEEHIRTIVYSEYLEEEQVDINVYFRITIDDMRNVC